MLTSATMLKVGLFVVTPDKDLMRITDVDRDENRTVRLLGTTRNGGDYTLSVFYDHTFYVPTLTLWSVTHEYDGGMTAYLVLVDGKSALEFVQDHAWMVEKLNINYSPSYEALYIAQIPGIDDRDIGSLRLLNGDPIPFYVDHHHMH